MASLQSTAPGVILAILAVSVTLSTFPWVAIGRIGGYTVHPEDLLFLLTMIYCVAGALVRRFGSFLELLLLVLFGLLVVNFTRGLVEAGPNAAGNVLRDYATLSGIVGFIYFWGWTLDREWILDKLVLLGWAIVGLAVFVLISGRTQDSVCADCEARSLNSNAALMLGQALLIAVNQAMAAPHSTKRQWKRAICASVFLVTLLSSQQRTATLATIAGLGVILLFAPKRYRNPVIGVFSVALLGGALVCAGAWVERRGDLDLTQYLPRAISWAINEEASYGWRVRQWEHYLEVYNTSPIFDQIVGEPLGALEVEVARTDDTSDLTAGAHSQYVALLIRGGIIGVVLFASVLVLAAIRGALHLSLAGGTSGRQNLRWALAVIVSLSTFSYTYQLPPEAGLPLALGLQIIGHVSRSRPLRLRSSRPSGGIVHVG